jgi:hypothetical protein
MRKQVGLHYDSDFRSQAALTECPWAELSLSMLDSTDGLGCREGFMIVAVQ